MSQFRTLLETLASNRSQLLTPEDIMTAIKEYDKLPEIMNADYNHIKQEISYRFRDFDKPIKAAIDKYRDDDRGYDGGWALPEELRNLGWDTPSATNQFKKFQKSVDALSKEYADVKQVCQYEIDRWVPLIDKFKALKKKVVKAATKREEKKAKEEKVLNNQRLDSKVMIDLLEDHRKEYITEANKRAKVYLKNLIDKLKKANWNQDDVAPYGRGSGESEMYHLYHALTDEKERIAFRKRSDPDIRKQSKAKEKKWLEDQAKIAELNYDAFINKMVQKIGEPVVEATMKGSIWTNATLDVVTASGEAQTWTTKIILNFSKFGKMFNQYPTRKKK